MVALSAEDAEGLWGDVGDAVQGRWRLSFVLDVNDLHDNGIIFKRFKCISAAASANTNCSINSLTTAW